MAFAALVWPPKPILRHLSRGLSLIAVLSLAACGGGSTFDQLSSVEPLGGAFSVALFKDYSFLARSFGTQADPAGEAFDADNSISLTDATNSVSGLAVSYAKKAIATARDEDVLPEAAPDGDADAENVRLELLKDLDQGRDNAPDDAARAQADYDCWIMNARVDATHGASKRCRRSLTNSLAKLERDLAAATASLAPAPASTDSSTASGSAAPADASANAAPTPAPSAPVPPPTPVPPPAPSAPQVAAAQTESNANAYAVYFPYRSSQIGEEQRAVIEQVIAAAKAGQQSRIMVVGHTDTAEDSTALALRRANVVKAVLIELGARPDAVEVSGVGKADLAVETEGHVKEEKNRRVVVTLLP